MNLLTVFVRLVAVMRISVVRIESAQFQMSNYSAESMALLTSH